ncbi:MAG: putative ABC transporter permease [Clostridia bacterium]|nr:putative ABC transporter permease [Clostridia bacterium]
MQIKAKHHACKAMVLFICGAIGYAGIEILWRGYTHWTMAVLGGALFLLLGGLNEWFLWDMPLWWQCIIGAAIVTDAEFITGFILNIWLGLGIWDYSGMWGNLFGQICPQYMLAWVGLSLVAIIIDDWLRYLLFGEERPHYQMV